MTIEEMVAKARAQLPKKAEPKGAAAAPSAEIKKTEEEVKKAGQEAEAKKVADEKAAKEAKAKDIEAQAKKDEEILSKKDEELDEDQKKRKVELVKIKKDAEDKDHKSNIQKRFDELTSKIKLLEEDGKSTKSERDSLKTELDGIKKQLSMTPQDKIKEKVKGELSTRQKKYLEEDKSLPKLERREMTKEELDELALEDYEGASEWVAKRTIRRMREEEDIRNDLTLTEKANVILDKQQKSAERTYVKHPELDIHKRQQELVKEGKSKQEIFEMLCKEVPKYKLGAEILKENPEKYLLAEDGPELIVAEIEKRLVKEPPKTEVDVEKEELKKKLLALETENATLKGLDTDITSNRQAETLKTRTELEKKQEELATKVGLKPGTIAKRVAVRAAKGYDS